MMPKIQKILYATDLSKNATYAFQYAFYLAEKLDARIVILHVVEKMSPDAQITLRAYLSRADQQNMHEKRVTYATERIESRLQRFCEKECQNHPRCKDKVVSIDVCEGYPAEEILKKAEQSNCDVIVMGAHEKGLTHTFLGSVAKSVLRRSRRPAFIVPLPKADVDLTVHD